MKRYERPLVTNLPDEAIDYSDIPELNDEFWQKAQLTMPETKERITLRVDKEIVDYFRQSRHGYQTRMNAVLRAYIEVQRRNASLRSRH